MEGWRSNYNNTWTAVKRINCFPPVGKKIASIRGQAFRLLCKENSI